jgi:tRNA(Ile)-lysidine synthase
MKLDVPQGKYVLAVSGGIDSMVLLDILKKQQNLCLVVAHFDHGVRKNSYSDKRLVEETAQRYNLPFETSEGKLGAKASEEDARTARYRFLRSVKRKYQANAIITAHHQDDAIETAFINILRGTGHRGISAIYLNKEVIRPLLYISKREIKNYAKANKVSWREDSTNEDTKYLRNYIRKHVMSRLSSEQKIFVAKDVEKVAKNSEEINDIIATISQKIAPNGIIKRAKFTNLPAGVENELVMYWLRSAGLRDYDRKMIEKLALILKTALPGTKHPVNKEVWLQVSNKTAEFSVTS